jgi:23S rRNA pseudouridine1911/1915/1917 synthase
VHRLDKDTSGILLAAKTPQAHAKLVEMFSQRQIHKDYLAICVGTPKEGLIDVPIKRHPIHRKEMAVCLTDGKEAKSICRVLKKNEQLSLVEIQLLTGRTHQIRVHLKHLGTPVLGDPVYGSASANKKWEATRQLLHALRLKFSHPMTSSQMEIIAPVPKDFSRYIEFFEKI